MRVSKEKAAENRAAILQAASRLFRKHGINGVGVAEIAKKAGLTHGALYAHFPSKDALVAEAFAHGFQSNMADTWEWVNGASPSFQEHLRALLSTHTRDKLETGCPMTASASEIARQGRSVSKRFSEAFEKMVAMLEGALEKEIPASHRRRLAVAAVSGQIGAMAVSRAITKSDSVLADEVLESVRDTFDTVYKVEADAAS